jgi:YegS/Rv2252/BmrU family lipid kinase
MSSIEYLFIINPISGTRSKTNIPSQIYSNLNCSKDKIEIQFTTHKGHANQLAKEAVKKKIPKIISVGGDGTMNEIANALLGTDTALGIIPMGSGNGLARHAGIPMQTAKAIQHLNQATGQWVDSGSINGHAFFCTAGIGIEAQVTHAFEQLPSRGLKTYIVAAFNELRKYKAETFFINIDDSIQYSGKYIICSFANANQYGNNAYIAPQAKINDNKLDLVLVPKMPWYQLLNKASKLFTKKIHLDEDITQHSFEQVRISRTKAGPIQVDGETLHAEKDIVVCIQKEKLKLLH